MAVASTSTVSVELVPLDRVRAVRNLRASLVGIPELAESIKRHGVLTAILVEPLPDGDYELVAGFRRHAAAVMAGLDRIPAVIRDMAEERARLASQVAENVDRLDLSDLEKAGAMQQLLDLGATSEDVAAVVGSSADAVDAWTAVLRLPQKARRLVADGSIAMSDAVRLATIADSKKDLSEALTEISRGHAPSVAVDRIVKRREVEAKRTAAAARLESEGCPVMPAPQWDSFSQVSRAQRLGKGRHGVVDVPVAKHRKESCHAAFIDRQGDVVYICTDRRRHEVKSKAAAAKRKAELAASRVARRELRESHASRLEALTAAVRNGAFGAAESLRHVLTRVLWDADSRTLAAACEFLEVPVPDGFGPRELRAILGYAGDDIDRLVTACLAVAIANGERHLTADKPQYGDRRHVASLHGAFLTATGVHHLTEAERAVVAERGLQRWDDRLVLVPGATTEPDPEDGETSAA